MRSRSSCTCRRVRLIDVLQFMEQVVEFGHGRPLLLRILGGPIICDLEVALLDLL